MQAIFETLFDVCYLTGVIVLGMIMIVKSQGSKQYHLFGTMAILLGLGDSFHLVPRAVALCTTGLEHFTAALGIGKFITSVTMTVFYVILYHVWRVRYNVTDKAAYTVLVYVMAGIRILLCFLPQNAWTSPNSPLSWGIYRNIPFTILGLFIIILFYRSSRTSDDRLFKHMWLTILISFGFYLPVVLFSDMVPMVGMLMIPKTLAYVWTVWIGYHAMKAEKA